jgi:hypothetical protein
MTVEGSTMNQYHLRLKLNDVCCKTGFLYDQVNLDKYIQLCKIEFNSENTKTDETTQSVLYLLKKGMITTNKRMKQGVEDILSKSPSEIIDFLKNGDFVITPYGRANLDINYRDGEFQSSKEIIENTQSEISTFKNIMYAQILTLMGIILAVITFINVGANLFQNPDYFKLPFLQQISSVIALYIPLIIIIVILLLGLYLIMKISNAFVKHNRSTKRS